jgi:hypothetical protein
MLTVQLIMKNRYKELHYQNSKHRSLKIQYVFICLAGLVHSKIVYFV